jgi:hypothetical protein
LVCKTPGPKERQIIDLPGRLGKRFFFPAIHQGTHEHGVKKAADFVLDFINRLGGIGIENFLKPIQQLFIMW